MRSTRKNRLLVALRIGALGAMLISTHAQARLSGTEMLQDCEQAERGAQYLARPSGSAPSKADVQQAERCLYFLIGLQNGIIIGEVAASAKGFFCPSPEVTYDQYLRVALLWLRNHPERLHEEASALIAIAFRDAFPCPKSPPPKTEKK